MQRVNSSAIADHMTQTGHRIKCDHFGILATGESDIYCKIKKTLLIRDLAVRNVFSTSHLNVSSRLTRSVYFRLLFRCHYFLYLVLFFVFKFYSSLGNRYS